MRAKDSALFLTGNKEFMDYKDYEIPQDLSFKTRNIMDMGGLNMTLALNAVDFTDVLNEPAQIKKARLKLRFSVMPKEILAQGSLSGIVEVQCSRCLKMYCAGFEEEFTQLYPTKDEIIDIMYITKQTLALLESIRNVCSEDCKGLCAICGCNKNDTDCGCKPPASSSLACLKDKFLKE
jgi:uncharacterized protein